MSSVYARMFWLKFLGLGGQQEDWSMSEVPVLRNCDRRNSSWFMERTVDQSARIDAGADDNLPMLQTEIWIMDVMLIA